MTTTQTIEVAIAAGLAILSIVVYRRKGPEGQGGYGNQGAVLVLFIAIILAIHGLGLMEYRPSQGEIDRAQAQAAGE
jgi:hypothetical protein